MHIFKRHIYHVYDYVQIKYSKFCSIHLNASRLSEGLFLTLYALCNSYGKLSLQRSNNSTTNINSHLNLEPYKGHKCRTITMYRSHNIRTLSREWPEHSASGSVHQRAYVIISSGTWKLSIAFLQKKNIHLKVKSRAMINAITKNMC